MTHSHRRTNAHQGPFPSIPADLDTTDYKALRVRSTEDKTHAALQAQRRAAANRDEVLRDTTHLAEENDRHARDQTHRQSSRSWHDSNSERGQIPRTVRFSSTATQQESVKHLSAEGKQTGSDRDQPRDHRSTRTSEANQPTHSWTSKLKAFTSFSQKDKSPRTEMHTTTYHSGHHHRRRQHSVERIRPQPAQAHASADTNDRSKNDQDRHSQPPPISHYGQAQSAPFHQPAPLFQHYIQSTPTQRMDVYLNAGPSDRHVIGGHSIPMPNAPPHQQVHAAPAQQGQSFQPPPPPRQADFFGQIAMHCLQNVQSAAQHQQQPYPPSQPQQHRVEILTPGQGQAQGQAQPASGEEKPATYPVPKNKMPVWDDQSQSVRWEWR